MLIGELSRKTGLSKDTIRFYEKTGLLDSGQMQRRENNYRDYSQTALNRLLVIRDLKEFGFTLLEIAEMLALYEADPTACPDNIPKIQTKIQAIEQKIHRLSMLRERLQFAIKDCQLDCASSCELNKSLSTLAG